MSSRETPAAGFQNCAHYWLGYRAAVCHIEEAWPPGREPGLEVGHWPVLPEEKMQVFFPHRAKEYRHV